MKRFYYNRKEITRKTGKSDPTLARWEAAGLFPQRKRIGPNSVGWPNEPVDAWFEDPEAWAQENQPKQFEFDFASTPNT